VPFDCVCALEFKVFLAERKNIQRVQAELTSFSACLTESGTNTEGRELGLRPLTVFAL
jgi:hypothetical protein